MEKPDMDISEIISETDSELAKSNFLARMSHEMRTPLNAILGMDTIAQNSRDPEQTLSCLIKINEAAMHLLGMINDILDIAQIETGKLKLVNSEFSLAMILKKTVEMIKFNLDEKKLNLVLDYDPELPETVICDGQKLTQVLYNLLSNAAKFTPPEGTITLSVKKLKEEEKTCTLDIKISDTGIGISKEDLKKLFVAFEQLDGGFKRKFGGAGVGLALCQNIIRLFGGTISVDSTVGKGSCFGFVISLEKSKNIIPEYCPSMEKSQIMDSGPTKFRDLSIMLAEDVEINREIVISLLEDTNIPIECAENGVEALDLYRANPEKYGLILMDLHMPEMDGLESTRQIRTFEAELRSNSGPLREVPIIAMTANVFKDDIENCYSAGMNGHLGKPIDFSELMKQICSYLT